MINSTMNPVGGDSLVGNHRVSNQLVLKGSAGGHKRSVVTPVIGKPVSKQANRNFEEIIRDIDESINAFSGSLNSNLSMPNLSKENKERRMLLDVLVLEANTTREFSMEKLSEKLGAANPNEEFSGGSFHVGWTAGIGD